MRQGVGAALLAVTLALPATAQGAPITGGGLDWTQVNVYETSAPAGTNRTWLGYTTGLAAGTATATAPATGAAVTPASPRGADVRATFGYAVTSGDFDELTRRGSIELGGAVTFTSQAHGFTISIEQPRVELDGAAGRLFASGKGATSKGAVTYDRTSPVLSLDLSKATTSTEPDGTRVIDGIVPAIATADYVFPQSYGAGAGPERTPNTFGSFTLRMSAAVLPGSPPAERPGEQTAAPGAPTSGNGEPAAKARTARTRSVVLSRAPFRGRAKRWVRLRSRFTRKVLATGSLQGRRLRLTAVPGRRVAGLSGRYVLTIKNSSRKATVVLP